MKQILALTLAVSAFLYLSLYQADTVHSKANNNKIYTPKMYVNGVEELNGSNQQKLQTILNKGSDIALIPISKMHQKMKVNLPNIKPGSYEIRVYGVQMHKIQKTKTGETASHGNVVISETKPTSWRGNRKISYMPIPKSKNVDKAIILIQTKNYGKIVAAGQFRI